ncbi:MAG: zf-TFIIB domain-containing protein [Vicinamibacterales bacterium]
MCSNCRAPLTRQTFDGMYGRSVDVDICEGCQGLWFDDMEALRLSPRGTLSLLKLIHRASPERRPLHERLTCPRCNLTLSRCVDQQRTTKFQYHRCARGHGRFMTFFHFLRARNFVRNLTPREFSELKANVRAHLVQVNCSNCGAPLDLDHADACQFCRAPISALDPEQMQQTIAALEAADANQRSIDPTLPLNLMLERLKVERLFREANQVGPRPSGAAVSPLNAGQGLVEAGVALVLGAWSDGW